LSRDELKNFYRAVRIYREKVVSEYDRMLQAA
jgi:hypothetical protein